MVLELPNPKPGEKHVLKDGEIADIVRVQGWSGGDAVKMIAIALAESRGNAFAHNPIPPDDSYGLWQVNIHGGLRDRQDIPKIIREGLPNSLYNPVGNAMAARSIYEAAGNSFRPWSVYTAGTYRIYMGRARDAWANPIDYIPPIWDEEQGGNERDNPLDRIGDIADTVGRLNDAFQFVTDPDNWKRVGLFVGGGVLVTVGIVAMFGPEMVKAGYKVASYAPQARALRGK